MSGSCFQVSVSLLRIKQDQNASHPYKGIVLTGSTNVGKYREEKKIFLKKRETIYANEAGKDIDLTSSFHFIYNFQVTD